MSETAVRRLLSALEARPEDGPDLIRRATAGKDGKAVIEALGTDLRFAPSLHRICQDPRQLDDAKWIVQFLFPLAPDGHERAGLSGRPPIGFELPCDRDDPRLSNLRRSPKLSTFVRRSLRALERETRTV